MRVQYPLVPLVPFSPLPSFIYMLRNIPSSFATPLGPRLGCCQSKPWCPLISNLRDTAPDDRHVTGGQMDVQVSSRSRLRELPLLKLPTMRFASLVLASAAAGLVAAAPGSYPPYPNSGYSHPGYSGTG